MPAETYDADRKVPVAYLVFNRPPHTRRTFEAIRAYRPSQLLVVADGPRAGRPDDRQRCEEVRRIVAQIDWPCEVHREYTDTNLGCGRRVSSGLDWVFSIVESAAVLEDDCLASPEFFRFCEQLLARYRDNPAVWAINSNSFQPHLRRGDGSYYFSKYSQAWGWATWRRAWSRFQFDLPFLEAWHVSPRWQEAFPVKSEGRYFHRVFREVVRGRIDTWDYQWLACVIHGGGLCATPNANLVKNIGFDDEGTHTLASSRRYSYELSDPVPLVHPSTVRADLDADDFCREWFGLRRGAMRAFADRLKDFALNPSGRRRGLPR